jgi:Host cell surface-exposed lipoprotein
MNKKHFTALTTAMLLVIGGVAAGAAEASPASQQNAVRSAEDYIGTSSFSREELIDQLEYDDFSTEDATFAVDHITVDWNEQAARSAKEYLDMSGYSHAGLVDQLKDDGFTPEQAEYGVAAAGL